MIETSTTNALSTAARLAHSIEVDIRKRLSADFSLNVRFSAKAGFTVLFGASGTGKTTLLDCVAGLLAPDQGRIAIGDRVVFDTRTNIPAEQRRVGYVFQSLALFPHLTVEQNVAYGLVQMEENERERRIGAILDSFRIAHLRKRKPGEISGGERQRVALARALVTDPGVLLLDEPLSALDAATKSRILDDLRTWIQRSPIPALYVTHSREEVFALAEYVLLLEQGRVLAEGSPYEVLETPRHETVAELAGFENIFDAVVASLHEAQGTMTVTLQPDPRRRGETAKPVSIEAPLTRAHVGDAVRVAIRAGDVLLATTRPEGLSARNVLRGRLLSLVRRDVRVVAKVDCGAVFQVHLTPAAETALALCPNLDVWIVIKTHSCHMLYRNATPSHTEG